MNKESWNSTSSITPQDGAKIYWMQSDGAAVEGIFKSNLWWFKDMSMYIYYCPKYWKYRE